MKHAFSIIVLLLLFSNPVSGITNSIYFCKDTKGDLKGPKRQFLINVINENYLFLKFISEKGLTNSPEVRYEVVNKSNSTIIAIADYKTGVASISFNYSKKKIISIRTFVDEGYAFAEHSDCFLQK